MRQTLLGVASFHRACLLAQDFTHEPACQTGERAPQGRFRHQPEQIVLAACLLSIPACLRRGGPVLSLAELRHPTDIFLGNQGTASPFCLPVSVSGTGRGCRQPGTRLPGDVFCAASSPGIASDRLWPTLSRATTIRSRRIRTVSAGSSSARP